MPALLAKAFPGARVPQGAADEPAAVLLQQLAVSWPSAGRHLPPRRAVHAPPSPADPASAGAQRLSLGPLERLRDAALLLRKHMN